MINTPTPALPSNVEELRLYDGAMDDPSDPYRWEIAKPGGAGIAKFKDETQARIAFAAISRASTPTEKEALIDELIEICCSLCEPEQADEKANAYTRTALKKSFSAAFRARSASVTDALQKRPVAFRVQDAKASSGYMLFYDERDAARFAEEHACEYQGLYVRDGTSTPPSQGKVERAREMLAQAYSKIFASAGTKEALIRNGKNPSIPANAAVLAISQALTEPAQGTSVEAMREAAAKVFREKAVDAAKLSKLLLSERKREDARYYDDRANTFAEAEFIIRALSRAPSPPQEDGGGLVEAIEREAHRWETDERTLYPDNEVIDSFDKLRRVIEALAPTPKASDHAPARAESVAPTQTEEEA